MDKPLNAGRQRMPRSTIERIRDKIRQRQYDMTGHAMEEMAEDDLDIVDVEQSILSGSLVRIDRNDPRGTKYVVKGLAQLGDLRVRRAI
jgi:hypothetical protein